MKYASYSPFTGTAIYVIELLVVLGANYFLLRHSSDKVKKVLEWSTFGQIVSIFGDAYFWYTSSVLVPIAFPYSSDGEQFTVFAVTLWVLLTTNLIVATSHPKNPK